MDGREPTGLVEGKTFEEWVEEYKLIVTEYQALELALTTFGIHPDLVVVEAPAELEPERKA